MNAMIEAVSNALFHFLWQGCVVALVLALALRLTPRAASSLRYAMTVGALALMVALPLATVALSLVDLPETTGVSGATIDAAPAASSTPIAATAPGAIVLDAGLPQPSLRGWVVAAWLLGVLALVVVNTGGWLRVHRLRRSGRPVSDPQWASRLATLRERLGVRRWVEVVESNSIDVPTLIGWIRPMILVPTSAFVGMSPQALEALLLHELAHVRRHDYLVNLLQAAVETTLFYHPAVWWVSHQARCEREHCCDDVAVAICGNRRTYIQALADMEQLRMASPRLALAADGGSLLTRVQRLTQNSEARRSGAARWWMGFAVIGAALAVSIVQLASSAPANAEGTWPTAPSESSSLTPATGTAQEASAASATLPSQPAQSTSQPSSPTPASQSADALDSSPISAVSLASQSSRPSRSSRSVRTDATALSDRAIEGRWWGERRWGGVWLELRRGDRRRSQTSFVVERDELTGTGEDGIAGFRLRRDAGTFFFEGELSDAERGGDFTFRGNTDYPRQLRRLGFDMSESIRELYSAAVLDVSLEFAEGIANEGYDDISMDRLIEFRIHGVTPEFIAQMGETGYEKLPPSRLVEFRIHGVSPEFVRGMARSGLDGLAPSRLVEFRIHGVSPEFVTEMVRSGFEGLSASKLVEFRIHGVTPEFVKAMADSGFQGLSPSRLVEFRIHGITPEFVRGMAQSGFQDMPASRLVEFKIHGVSPEFVRKMQDSGLGGLSASKLVEFRIHGVTPEFVRKMADVGLDSLEPSRLVEFRIHGVTPDFVREMTDLGLRGVTPSRLVEMRIHGVTPAFARRAVSRYGDDLSARDLVEMRIHGWDGGRDY